MTPAPLLRRLLALFRTRRMDRELADEVRAHLELAERDAIASGLSPEEARRIARRRFGSIDVMREVHRDRRSVRWIETLANDCRYLPPSLARGANQESGGAVGPFEHVQCRRRFAAAVGRVEPQRP